MKYTTDILSEIQTWCHYADPPTPPVEEIEYGALYNWYAATDVKEITSAGWHIPILDDYDTLYAYLESNHGGKLKETGVVYWDAPNTDATNETGFNLRASGYRNASGTFLQLGEYGYFIFLDGSIYYAAFGDKDSGVLGAGGYTYVQGFSLRLIKDSTTLSDGETGTYTGNDGKVYRTICIGTQEWLADNLAETLYRDGTPIPEVTDNAAWAALVTGAMCYYNNDISNA